MPSNISSLLPARPLFPVWLEGGIKKWWNFFPIHSCASPFPAEKSLPKMKKKRNRPQSRSSSVMCKTTWDRFPRLPLLTFWMTSLLPTKALRNSTILRHKFAQGGAVYPICYQIIFDKLKPRRYSAKNFEACVYCGGENVFLLSQTHKSSQIEPGCKKSVSSQLI